MVDFSAGDDIFKEGDVSSELFILQDGTLDVFVRDNRNREKKVSEISAPGSIFGEIGAILKQPRSATIRATSASTLNVIDVTKRSLDDTILATPKLGLSISINLAKYTKVTNKRLADYTSFLNKIRNQTDKYLLFFYEKGKYLNDLHDKLRFPWIKSIADKVKGHMIYTMGEGVSNGKPAVEQANIPPPPEKSGDTPELTGAVSYPAGAVLCSEGEPGKEIFILQTGTLEVQVGGRKVADISEKGQIIGEVAVLNGYATRQFEPRSATIIVREPATVIVIDGSKLEAVITANPSLILFTTKVLSERLPETNHALLAADDQIKKYMAFLSMTSVTSMTIISGLELLETSLRSGAKDREEVAGMDMEVNRMIVEFKDIARDLEDEYDAISAS